MSDHRDRPNRLRGCIDSYFGNILKSINPIRKNFHSLVSSKRNNNNGHGFGNAAWFYPLEPSSMQSSLRCLRALRCIADHYRTYSSHNNNISNPTTIYVLSSILGYCNDPLQLWSSQCDNILRNRRKRLATRQKCALHNGLNQVNRYSGGIFFRRRKLTWTNSKLRNSHRCVRKWYRRLKNMQPHGS